MRTDSAMLHTGAGGGADRLRPLTITHASFTAAPVHPWRSRSGVSAPQIMRANRKPAGPQSLPLPLKDGSSGSAGLRALLAQLAVLAAIMGLFVLLLGVGA